MIDTHCHLYSNEFYGDIELVMARATAEGIVKFYLPAIDACFTESMNRIEKLFPDKCFAMAGLHPCSVKENFEDELNHVETLLQQRPFKGIGETGLDFYWDKTFVNEQYKALERQIEYALEYKLPLILHTRNATQQTIDVVKKYVPRGLKGIFHCFTGTSEEAQKAIELNFLLGVGGVATFKNGGLEKVLPYIDLKHIVLETDAPYLAPVPYRGKRNEPVYLQIIAEKVADLMQVSVDDVIKQTSLNAQKLTE